MGACVPPLCRWFRNGFIIFTSILGIKDGCNNSNYRQDHLWATHQSVRLCTVASNDECSISQKFCVAQHGYYHDNKLILYLYYKDAMWHEQVTFHACTSLTYIADENASVVLLFPKPLPCANYIISLRTAFTLQ